MRIKKRIREAIEEIRHKIVDELDSTYYFSYTYPIGNPAANAEPLSQFFYAVKGDKVYQGRQSLSIYLDSWEGRSKDGN